MFETSSADVDAAKRFGIKTLDGAKSPTGKLSSGLGQRLGRLRRNDTRNQDGDEIQ